MDALYQGVFCVQIHSGFSLFAQQRIHPDFWCNWQLCGFKEVIYQRTTNDILNRQGKIVSID
jgi:hypothetical protein